MARILAIVGSLRRASYNRALVDAVAAALPAGSSLTTFERLGELPIFDPDAGADPDAVVALKAEIAGADGVLFATAEYNYSVPGVLKNAIDWVSRPPATTPLRGKPVAVIGASSGMSGSMRAQAHLREMMLFFDAPMLGQPEVLVARASDRFVDGVLTDEPTRAHLGRFATAFLAHIARFG